MLHALSKPIFILILCALIFEEPKVVAQDDRFTIDLISSEVENGGAFIGLPGTRVSIPFQIQLTTTVPGLFGLTLPLGGRGANISFITQENCGAVCADALFRGGDPFFFLYYIDGRNRIDPNYVNTTGALAGTGAQGPGVVLAFSTDLIIKMVTYPAGTFTVGQFTAEVTMPDLGSRDTVSIDLKNGLSRGSRNPQNLTVSFDFASFSATVNEFTFDVVSGFPKFVRGDSDHDGRVEMSDITHLIEYLYLGKGEPQCQAAADSNDDNHIDISDILHLIGIMYLGYPTYAPGLNCGTDNKTTRKSCLKGKASCES